MQGAQRDNEHRWELVRACHATQEPLLDLNNAAVRAPPLAAKQVNDALAALVEQG